MSTPCPVIAERRSPQLFQVCACTSDFYIEFSTGILSMKPDEDTTVEDLLREAEVLMYEKKLDEMPKASWSNEDDLVSAPAQGDNPTPRVPLLD